MEGTTHQAERLERSSGGNQLFCAEAVDTTQLSLAVQPNRRDRSQLQVEENYVALGLCELVVFLVTRLSVCVLQSRVHTELFECVNGCRLLEEDGKVQWCALVGVALYIEIKAHLDHGFERDGTGMVEMGFDGKAS